MEVNLPILAALLLVPLAGLHAADDARILWEPSMALPKTADIPVLQSVRFSVIKPYEIRKDGYRFLHGVALAWHKGRLFASFAHNKGVENTDTEEARYCVSDDDGKTWSPVATIDKGSKPGESVSHGVFLFYQGQLWTFHGAFTGFLKKLHTLAYVFNETEGTWQPKGMVIEGDFWPCQEPVRMGDGNWIMSGFRVGVTGEENKVPSAVAISHGDDLIKWDVVPIRAPASNDLWGESTVFASGKQVVNIARYGAEAKALMAVSEDYGRTWSRSLPSNLPMATSKPYAGTLSTGQHYLIGTTTADSGKRRSPLTIAVTRPGESVFRKVFVIRHAVFSQGPGESHLGAAISYPYAIEHAGYLYVGYSNNGGNVGRVGAGRELANNNSAELAVIPIESLRADAANRPSGASAAAQATTYYVDSQAGSDANDGRTMATAWHSLSRVNAITFQPGDRLLFKAGSAWTGQLHPRGSGNAVHRITLNCYGEGPKPVIHGGGIAGGAVLLEDQQYWSIRNLNVTNQGSPAPKKMGILIRNNSVGTLSGIEVTNCDIHDVAGDMADYKDGKESGGIVFYVTAANLATPSRWDDIRIENNAIHDVARNGVLMQSLWINKPNDPKSSWRGHGGYTASTNICIAGNRVERVGGDGIILWCAKGAIVQRNFVCRANGNTLKQGHAAVWPYFCEEVVFQHNEVCETKTKFDGMAFDFDNSNQHCIYQYNYSHDNEGGFLNMCCDGNANGNIARYNISQNDGCIAGSRVFLVHGNGNHRYQVYNNTVYVRNGNPAMFHQGADSKNSSIAFANNIFINAGDGSFVAPKGCRFDCNLYFGAGSIANDARKTLADPRLLAPGSGQRGLASAAGYKLSAGSPALNTGVLIIGNGGLDYWGNPVSDTSIPHLGAYNGCPISN